MLLNVRETSSFVHELMHVYQQRTLDWSRFKVGYEQLLADGDYCYRPLETNKPFFSYNQEEQAEMVSDRFILNKGLPVQKPCNRPTTLQQLNEVIDL